MTVAVAPSTGAVFSYSFNPAPFLVLAVVFGVIAYLVSRNYGRRHGVTPWNLPSWVWGIIGFVSLLLWAILIIIAVNTTKKTEAQQPWPGQPPYPGYPPGPAPYGPGPYAPAPGDPYAPAPGVPTAAPAAPGSGPPPYPAAPALPPPGWYPDPGGRHQSRYWDGTTWTEHVADGSATSTDPL